ncbi:MAG: cytochrome c [Bdellovibrionales bacterium]|nr:cytochrome c [Bdellovibrionales bacterium]
MLSKRQAKIFFLGGTVFFGVIFLALSVDSLMNGIPKNTNAQNITAQVAHGRYLWDRNNCMGCHTLMGEGAYYGPELTKVYERRGPDYIKTALNFEGGWGPRGRRMVQYNFTEEEQNDIVAFFEWVGKMNLNGFPAAPPLKR